MRSQVIPTFASSLLQRSNKYILTLHSIYRQEWKEIVSFLINLGSNKKCFFPSLAEFNDPECNDFDYNRTRERNNRVRSFLSFVPDPNEQLRARFSPEWNFEREPPFHSIKIIGRRKCAAIPWNPPWSIVFNHRSSSPWILQQRN